MIGLDLLTAVPVVVCLVLAFLVWRSAEAHRTTRARLANLRKERNAARAALDAVDVLAPEFRKAFPRRDFWTPSGRPLGVDWEGVRQYADAQKNVIDADVKARRLAMEKINWDNARKTAMKGK